MESLQYIESLDLPKLEDLVDYLRPLGRERWENINRCDRYNFVQKTSLLRTRAIWYDRRNRKCPEYTMNNLITGTWLHASKKGEGEDFLDFAPILKMNHIELAIFKKIVDLDQRNQHTIRISQADLERLHQLKPDAAANKDRNEERVVSDLQWNSDEEFSEDDSE